MRNENEKNLLNDEDDILNNLMKVQIYTLGAFTLDVQKRLLTFKGESKKLTTKENDLLMLFAANANEIMDRKYALKTIWKDDNYFNARSMDVYICKLRKLLLPDPDVFIINIHGKGYRLISPSK